VSGDDRAERSPIVAYRGVWKIFDARVEEVLAAMRQEQLRMTESAAGRQAEDELMDLLARNIDPVIHLARFLVAPEMARDLIIADMSGAIEARPG
jgi:hypothetical protein